LCLGRELLRGTKYEETWSVINLSLVSERMNPLHPVSKAQLAALITFLHDKPCALCRVVYHSHQSANHLFYDADEDIPLDEQRP
jgi:hypothetical protein